MTNTSQAQVPKHPHPSGQPRSRRLKVFPAPCEQRPPAPLNSFQANLLAVLLAFFSVLSASPPGSLNLQPKATNHLQSLTPAATEPLALPTDLKLAPVPVAVLNTRLPVPPPNPADTMTRLTLPSPSQSALSDLQPQQPLAQQLLLTQNELAALKRQFQALQNAPTLPTLPPPTTPPFLAIVIHWPTLNHSIDLTVQDPAGYPFNGKHPTYAHHPGEVISKSPHGPGSEIWQSHHPVPGTYQLDFRFAKTYGNFKPTQVSGTLYTNHGIVNLPLLTLDFKKKNHQQVHFSMDEQGAVALETPRSLLPPPLHLPPQPKRSRLRPHLSKKVKNKVQQPVKAKPKKKLQAKTKLRVKVLPHRQPAATNALRRKRPRKDPQAFKSL